MPTDIPLSEVVWFRKVDSTFTLHKWEKRSHTSRENREKLGRGLRMERAKGTKRQQQRKNKFQLSIATVVDTIN